MKYPGRVIRAGESDPALVRAVRTQLNHRLSIAARSPGRLDERAPAFDEAVVQAVRQFQARNVDHDGRPLTQDGRIGPITWEVLFDGQSVPSAIKAADPYLGRMLTIALGEADKQVREVPANSNRGPRVEQYQKRSKSRPGLAWCCSFVYWCMDEAAVAMSRRNPMVRTAGCLDHWHRSPTAGAKRIKKAQALQDPSLLKPGMIFIMDHGGGFGHTGIIAEVNGGFLNTVEGNTDASRTREGGGVYRLTRKIGEINLGYIDYAGLNAP
ncbi:MAG: CHAP domain-containing protein [Gemmatimonadota bacterium]